MREYELVIDKALTKGLFPTRSIPTNSEWLWGALGFRVGREVLTGYRISDDDDLVSISGIDFHYNWPFPQFIVGESYNILVVRNALTEEDIVYQVSNYYGTVVLIATIDEAGYGQGGLMEVADFGEYCLMVNGVATIHWDPAGPGWTEPAIGDTLPQMGTVCNLKGQAIGGNVTSVFHDCDETFYVWSKIGDIDFTPGIDNEAGYRRCPYGGEVLNVRRLGNSVVGYSSKGITLLTPVSEPATTISFTELDDVGLINKGAVDGDIHRQIYVGSDLVVREVTAQGVKELGYSYFMDELDEYNIIVKYDRTKKDFYIGDDEYTFLLSPYGLTAVPQHPSALWTLDHEYAHEDEISMLPNTVDTGYVPAVISDIFDMGYRGQKTISSVETDIIAIYEPSVLVGAMNTIRVMNYTDAIRLNDEGIGAAVISGNEFAVMIRFDDADYIIENAPMRYIKVRYKMTDLRGIKGVYTPKYKPSTNYRGQG
jgi:hypothetical protein